MGSYFAYENYTIKHCKSTMHWVPCRDWNFVVEFEFREGSAMDLVIGTDLYYLKRGMACEKSGGSAGVDCDLRMYIW